jgi:hypothetical protein
MEEKILLCACSSAEHQIMINVDNDDPKDPIVYCTIHLAKLSFFERLVHGIKYIFGYRCKYGDFEEFIFKPEHKDKVKEIYDCLNKSYESDHCEK